MLNATEFYYKKLLRSPYENKEIFVKNRILCEAKNFVQKELEETKYYCRLYGETPCIWGVLVRKGEGKKYFKYLKIFYHSEFPRDEFDAWLAQYDWKLCDSEDDDHFLVWLVSPMLEVK